MNISQWIRTIFYADGVNSLFCSTKTPYLYTEATATRLLEKPLNKGS